MDQSGGWTAIQGHRGMVVWIIALVLLAVTTTCNVLIAIAVVDLWQRCRGLELFAACQDLYELKVGRKTEKPTILGTGLR